MVIISLQTHLQTHEQPVSSLSVALSASCLKVITHDCVKQIILLLSKTDQIQYHSSWSLSHSLHLKHPAAGRSFQGEKKYSGSQDVMCFIFTASNWVISMSRDSHHGCTEKQRGDHVFVKPRQSVTLHVDGSKCQHEVTVWNLLEVQNGEITRHVASANCTQRARVYQPVCDHFKPKRTKRDEEREDPTLLFRRKLCSLA